MSIWIFTFIRFIKIISLTWQSLLVATSAQGVKSTCVQDCLCTKGTSVHWAFSGYRTSGMGVDQVAIEQLVQHSSFLFSKIEWWAGRWEAGQSGWHSAAPQVSLYLPCWENHSLYCDLKPPSHHWSPTCQPWLEGPRKVWGFSSPSVARLAASTTSTRLDTMS